MPTVGENPWVENAVQDAIKARPHGQLTIPWLRMKFTEVFEKGFQAGQEAPRRPA